MFPILPILILLLMGPANAERLAVEGRLPAVLLAVHRTMASPVRAIVVASLEEEACAEAASDVVAPARPRQRAFSLADRAFAPAFYAGWPPRAGPASA